MIRYIRRHPLSGFLLGMLALAVLNTALQWVWAVWHLLPGLLVMAGAGTAAYTLGKRRGALRARPAKVIQGRAEDGEVIRLRAEVEALRTERDQAQQAARAAWQPRTGPSHETAPPGPGGATRDRLLADPRSGVHPLGGPR